MIFEVILLEHDNSGIYNIFPELTYAVDRIATPAWQLNNKMHTHNLMLLYDGKAEFRCNESRFTAGRGDLIYYKPGDMRHAVTFPGEPVKCYAVNFKYICPEYSNNEWKLTDYSLPFSFWQKITDSLLLQKLNDLFSELTKSALTARVRTDVRERAILTEILVLLFKFTERNQFSYSNAGKVENVIEYMTENYSTNMTLGELAEYANVSPSYLGSIFRSVTGRSPIDYLIEIRINRAKNLLKDGYSVTDTSRLSGFNDIYYFSRMFKRHEGISPSEYIRARGADILLR